MPIVSAPEIEIVGKELVYHKIDVPYIDPGASAKRLLADGTCRDVPVTTVSNTVPAVCDTLSKYEVLYEAVGPHGYAAFAQRSVEIGQFACNLNFCSRCELCPKHLFRITCSFIVSVPEIKIIGDDSVRHEKDFPYIDLGATAKILLADGTHRDLPVTTVLSTVPPPCNTLGKYEVHYEATGPHGFTSRRVRHVQIGLFAL